VGDRRRDRLARVGEVVVLRDASKIYCAWNLVTGGTARAMNAANTTENFTPTLNVA
jgi:hypothetical protein